VPVPEYADLRQFAVWWQAISTNRYGQQVVDPQTVPHEVRCRWVEILKESLDPKRRVVGIDVDLITDFAIPMGSIVWLGKLDDIAPGTVPSPLFEVVTNDSGVDIKARIYRYQYGLKRFNAVVPTS
jgi:hypothetical protein